MDVLNFSAAERVDLADLNFAAQESPLGFARELGQSFALGSGNTQKMWVVSGFKATNPAGNQIQVGLGSAFLARRVGLDVSYGVLTATGDATQSIDVTSFQSGTYGVYITFIQVPGEFQNRTFWQAGDTPGEYAQNVPTKLLANWQMTITALNPGAEWLQVASLTLPNNQLIDNRPLYFEGNPAAGYASNWGSGANDRNTDRSTYGVGDLQTMTAALRTAIEDVKGPGLTRWWENKIGGQNIGFAGTPTLGRTAWGDANFFAQGSATAPAFNFDATAALTYTRASQTFALAPGGITALSLAPTGVSTALTLAVGGTGQVRLSGASTTSSVFWAPAGGTALFEQRATQATLATLGLYAGTALGGTFDANRNWVLGSASSGYAYPTSSGTAAYAALTVADTSGNHLLRLDSSGTASVPAIASVRANNAATYLRFTPTATSLAATYNFQLAATPIGNSQATFTIGTAGQSHLAISQADNVADFSGATSVKAQSFVPASPYYDTYPSIYNMRLAAGTSNGAIQASQNGGYLQVVGTPNSYGQTVLIPVPLPNNASIYAVYVNFWHSGANGTSTVNVALWASRFTALNSGLPTAIQLSAVQKNINSSSTLTGNSVSLTGLTLSPGSYFNYFVSFGDYDSNGVDEIVSCHVYYTIPAVGAAVL